MSENMLIDEKKAFKELKMEVKEFGMDEMFCRIQTMEHQAVEIVGKDTFFFSHGPGILFVAFLPLDAFEESTKAPVKGEELPKCYGEFSDEDHCAMSCPHFLDCQDETATREEEDHDWELSQ